MEVKGTAFLGRRAMLAQEIGEERTAALIEAHRRAYPAFPETVLATTTMPLALLLAFNEMLVREIYNGDDKAYWRIGEKSAEWALTAGPYKHLRATRSLTQFAETGRIIYQSYFSAGRAETSLLDGNTIDLKLVGINAPFRHVYMEYSIVGYFRRGLEMVGARALKTERLLGFSQGDAEVHYRYTFQ